MSTGEIDTTTAAIPIEPVPEVQVETNDDTGKNGESSTKPPLPPLHETLLQRVSTIKEGDNVLLRMPSDMVKAVVASKDGYAQSRTAPGTKRTDFVVLYNLANSVLSLPNSFLADITI
jgi:hypothetical protein